MHSTQNYLENERSLVNSRATWKTRSNQAFRLFSFGQLNLTQMIWKPFTEEKKKESSRKLSDGMVSRKMTASRQGRPLWPPSGHCYRSEAGLEMMHLTSFSLMLGLIIQQVFVWPPSTSVWTTVYQWLKNVPFSLTSLSSSFPSCSSRETLS